MFSLICHFEIHFMLQFERVKQNLILREATYNILQSQRNKSIAFKVIGYLKFVQGLMEQPNKYILISDQSALTDH